MNLTNEQLARVFHLHVGVEAVMFNKENYTALAKEHEPSMVDYIQKNFPDKTEIKKLSAFEISCFKIEHILLKLIPISAISAEHLSILSSVYCNETVYKMEGVYINGMFKFYRIIDGVKSFVNNVYVDSLPATIYQQLLLWGYAVPIYIEAGHPDNGKTAIELGVAIAKTPELLATPPQTVEPLCEYCGYQLPNHEERCLNN